METPRPCLQGISPRLAHFCLSIEKFIRNDLSFTPEGRHFVVGLSGGVDSTALLTLLYLLQHRLGIHLSAAHLDHGLREGSEQEALHCKKLCQWLSIPFHLKSVSVASMAKSNKSIEEIGRNLRYAFYAEVCESIPHATLALGHHLNDLAEDVLMRLIRGAGWPSLSGMKAKDEARSLIRPLLLTPKHILENFIETLQIPYVVDASNEDLTYFRNRVRHTFLPLFLKENSAFLDTIANLWRLGTLDDVFFTSTLETTLTSLKSEHLNAPTKALQTSNKIVSFENRESISVPSKTIEKKVLESLSKSLRLRLYKSILEQFSAHPLSVSLFQLDTVWKNKKTGSIIQFPNNVCAEVQKGNIIFSKT